ncbi:hypothetical protein [Rhodococcus qingshengii]|uniref:hypothetical protein n=1 Tax=Rhodococcus qingshengii TaxID=334542 RepID=UPI0022B58233|nr:hypothetical protein [Rhodococcus qingshengii]MCZ4618396.1 hypothetical protein [Rhodococcus qingshengii]
MVLILAGRTRRGTPINGPVGAVLGARAVLCQARFRRDASDGWVCVVAHRVGV